MEKKDKEFINDKKRDFIYCVCIVLALLILAFGDQIVLHFIKQVPNNNIKVFENEENQIEKTFLKELTVEEILTKIEQKESFLLLSIRDNCYTCKTYLPSLKDIFTTNGIQGYYLNRSLYDMDNDNFKTLATKDERLKNNLQYTPYLMMFENGVLKDELVGSQPKETVTEFIYKNYVLL